MEIRHIRHQQAEYNPDMNTPDKAHFLERVSREMDEDPGVLDPPPREALAACCRILAREGHESGLAGQVTAVGEKPGSWWTLKFGLGFEEATDLAVFFERAARMQIRAMAAGGFKEVKPALAEEARVFLLQPSIVRGTFAYRARRSD